MEERGSGWIGFAGIMLIIVGALDIINGLWALDHKDVGGKAVENSSLLYEGKLETWGWIFLVWGILLLIAGFLVFGRSQFGRWIGVLAATISIIVNMTWIFAYQEAALIPILLGVLVLYALVVYGGRDTAYTTRTDTTV
jgi:hypothetical protein